MELFKITCVTCKAKLSVRNREIIGQIVACPRCDSMVQVEAPVAAAGAVAAVSPEPMEHVVEGNVVEDGVVEGSVVEDSVAKDGVAKGNAAERPGDFADAVDAATTEESMAGMPEQLPVDEISLPAVASVTKYRLLAWILSSVVVGAALGGAVLFMRGGAVEEEIAGSAEVTSQAENTAAEVPVEISAEPELETGDAAEPQATVPEEIASTVETAAEEIVNDESVVAVEPAQEVLQESSAAKPQAEVRTRVASRFDALDLDPNTLDLGTLKSASGKEIVAEPPAAAPDDVALPEDTQPVQAATLPAVRRDPAQQQGEKAQAAKLLEQRFQTLSVKAMPLTDLLRLISRLGGVPISVAPRQLQMAGITSRQSVSLNDKLDDKDISLAEALQAVLKPLHLEYATVGKQVVVVRQKATKIRTIEYPLEDLLNATTRLEDIAGWVKQLVGPAAQPPLEQAVSLKTSAKTMSIEQAQQFQYQVLIFLERIRLARGIPRRSRFPVKRLAGSAASAALSQRLRAPTTFTFSHYTPVDEIVGYWQQELGIPILVDWPALATLGIWPNSRLACSAEDVPWSAALDQVLEPLGLGWRAAVGGTVEITSAEKVQTELQLELYRLERELGNQTDRVLSELRSSAEKEPAKIAYDPAGQALFILQPAAGQRLVYQWLVDQKLMSSE